MFRARALTIASLTVLVLGGVGTARSGSMQSNPTGTVPGDWDIDTDQLKTERQELGTLDRQFFHVDWVARRDQSGQSEIIGRVH